MSLLKPCTCPWALGCRGVNFLCVNPISTANYLRPSELNRGPLSDWMVLNSLRDEDFFIFCHTGLMAVEKTNSTSGYLEYWSVMTSAYSAWEWSTEIDFNGLPRYLWQIRHFGWFCMLCVCRYLAVKASAHNGVNAIVHGREPILSM